MSDAIKPSPYLWKKFVDAFDQGTQFWTSEDGDACEWVIMRTSDWRYYMDHDHGGTWDIEATAKTMREGFVCRCWLTRDYFDGPGSEMTSRRGWMLSEEPTEFPVLIFDPVYLPRGSR